MINKSAMINWKELIVTDAEGDCNENLESITKFSPSNLDNVVVVDGKITEWPGFFLSINKENISYKIPDNIDWDGFQECLNAHRGTL
jgi:hypothetical protein